MPIALKIKSMNQHSKGYWTSLYDLFFFCQSLCSRTARAGYAHFSFAVGVKVLS